VRRFRGEDSGQVFSSTTLYRPQANFLYQTCIAGLVKTLITTYWTHLRMNDIWAQSFCSQKTNNKMVGCLHR